MEEVLARYFSDESNKDEIKFVDDWKSQSESNAKEFFDAKIVWISTQQNDKSYQGVLDSILTEEPKQKQVFWNSSLFKYAAAASVLFVLSLVFLLRSGEVSLNYTSTDLADGSIISLHNNSNMKVLNFDENIREVSVTGKAYFDIERDENLSLIHI